MLHGIGARPARATRPAFGYQHRRRAVLLGDDVSDLLRHQLASPQQRVVGHGEQRAVARVDERIARGIERPLEQRAGETGGLRLSAAFSSVHARERPALGFAAHRRLEPPRAVRGGDARDIQAYRRRCPFAPHRLDVRGDRLGARRHRPHPVLFAPGGEPPQVRAQRPFAVLAERPTRRVLRRTRAGRRTRSLCRLAVPPSLGELSTPPRSARPHCCSITINFEHREEDPPGPAGAPGRGWNEQHPATGPGAKRGLGNRGTAPVRRAGTPSSRESSEEASREIASTASRGRFVGPRRARVRPDTSRDRCCPSHRARLGRRPGVRAAPAAEGPRT